MRQPARTPREATRQYRQLHQQALDCVSPLVHLYTGPSPLASGYFSLASSGGLIQLRTQGFGDLHLEVTETIEAVPVVPQRPHEFQIAPRAYYYCVYRGTDGTNPLIAWCWNQQERPYPHIHTTVDDPRHRGFRLHVPTGGRRLVIEDVVRFLIAELAVIPTTGDWLERLGPAAMPDD